MLFAAAVAFLLPVVFSPSVQATFWTPGAAGALLVAGVGAPLLLHDAVRRDRAALLATGFVGAAAVSAALARDPAMAVTGQYLWGTGLLFVVALAGAWSIGRRLGSRGATVVETAVLAGVLANAVVGLLELVVDLTSFQLGRFGDRVPGFLGNPVQLGGLLAGGVPLLAARARTSPRWAWWAVPLGAALQASGSRAGFVLAVAAAGIVLVRAPRQWLVPAALAAGVVLGALLTAAGGGESVSARLGSDQGGGGFRPRLEMWGAGADAVADRPLLGAGPGQFRAATSPYRTLDMARAEGTEKLYVDAHNLVVEYAVTTGLLGLALLGAWLAGAFRRARTALGGFAALVLANQLFQPLNVRTTTVAFLALGAAATTLEVRRRSRPVQAAMAAGAVAGLTAAGVLLVGDFHLEQGRLDFAADHADAADDLLGTWPEPATLVARIHSFAARTQRDRAELAAAIRWRREAVRRDPTSPTLRNALAEDLLAAGRVDEAIAMWRSALRWDPVSARALNGLAEAHLAQDDPERAAAALRRSIEISPGQERPRALLRGIESGR